MGIFFLQQVGSRSSGATISLPFISNSSGSLLTLVAMQGSTVAPVSTVTDSRGNVWHRIAIASNGVNPTICEQWYAANVASGSNTVSVTNANSANQIQCHAMEFLGPVSSPFVASSTNVTTTSTTHTPGSVSPSQSTVLFLVSYAFDAAFSATTPSGYSTLVSTFTKMQSFYKVVSTPGAENPATVTTVNRTSAAIISAFHSDDAVVVTSTLRRSRMTLVGVA
jgi:hypothetical protein